MAVLPSALLLLATVHSCGALVANDTGNASNVAHVHLSISGTGQMVVAWSAAAATGTGGSGIGSAATGDLPDERPCVRHTPAGKDISAGNMTPAKNVSLWRDRVWSLAEISGLAEGVPYVYQCSSTHGSSQGTTGSRSHGVKEFGPQLQMRVPVSTEVELGTNGRPARLAILGDFPVAEHGPAVVERILGGPVIDAALHLGDIAGNLSDEDGRRGEQFLRMVEPLASGVPYMTLRGDRDDPAAYSRLFHMPSKDDDTWYSLTIGPACILVLDTDALVEVPPGNGRAARQLAWLKTEMAHADTSAERWWRPWLIVAGHRPLYCSVQQPACGPEAQRLRAVLEPLLRKHHVDLYLSAHLRAYERTFPVANGSLCPGTADGSSAPNTAACAPVYIVNGDAGIPSLAYESLPARWTAHRHPGAAGHGELTLHNHTHLEYRQVATATGIVRDEFWLYRDAKEKPMTKPEEEDEEEEDFLEAIFWLALATAGVTGTCVFMRWVHGDGQKRREQALQTLRVELAVLSGVAPKGAALGADHGCSSLALGAAREVESLVQKDGKGNTSTPH